MGLSGVSSARQITPADLAEMNAAIATSMFGWIRIDSGLYSRPGFTAGTAEACPDFRINPYHEQLCEEMDRRGFKLIVTENPWSLEDNRGRTFTARLTRGSEASEATYADQTIAVCLAALDAVRCPVAA